LLPGSSWCYPDFAYRMLTAAYQALAGNENQEAGTMAKGRITKRSVDALQCPTGKDREILWDDAIAGFGVAAFPSGKKVYVAQYRQAGRSRRATIGEHGRLTPDEARSAAKKLLGVVEAGADPIAERHKERAARTFGSVAEEFLVRHVATKRKGRTADEYSRILQSRIMPAIGSKRIVDLRRADVAKLHAKLVATPYEANRVMALISAVWNWAARHDEVALADNPAKGVERYPERGRERFLTSEELARLGDALREGETNGLPWSGEYESKHTAKQENRLTVLDPFAVAAARLLILTGARLREILDAEWQQVDFERGILFLPDSKTGRKPIFLSAAAHEVLSSLPRIEGNPHIIAGAKDGAPRADLKRPWAAVRKAAGLDGVRLHDLRHSFASVGAGASLGLPIIGKLLGHKQAATTHRYAHLDADPMRRAAETIGATIAAAMDGKKGADVVPLKGMKASS
jgi:integrase